ncbi:MAG: hypothetical protein OEX19_04060 [Gammaproteobacteria bacterium]|nr:hypothetical protein [Gammaproteobacteria bacterium]
MDELEFRQTLGEVRDRPCVFQRPILQSRCGCKHSHKLFVAEREIIACDSINGFKECDGFMSILKKKAAFVLHLEDPEAPIPYAKAIKLQVGAILGLKQIMGIPEQFDVPDVSEAIADSRHYFHELDKIPYEKLFSSIRNTKRRRERKKEE